MFITLTIDTTQNSRKKCAVRVHARKSNFLSPRPLSFLAYSKSKNLRKKLIQGWRKVVHAKKRTFAHKLNSWRRESSEKVPSAVLSENFGKGTSEKSPSAASISALSPQRIANTPRSSTPRFLALGDFSEVPKQAAMF